MDPASREMRLAALARSSALLQGAQRDEEVWRAVREALAALDLRGALLVPAGRELRVRFVEAAPERVRRWEELLGGRLEGLSRPWTPPLRAAWRDGESHAEDWGSEVARFLCSGGEGVFPPGGEVQGIAVRIEVGGEPASLLVAAGEWLRRGDLPAFRLLGARISAALDAARVAQALRDRDGELAALNLLSAAAGAATDLDAFLRTGRDVVRDVLGTREVGVFLVESDRDGSGAAPVQGAGLAAEPAGLTARVDRSDPVAGRVLRDGAALIRQVADLPEPFRSAASARGVATVAAVPLRFRAGTIGVLVAGWSEPREAGACRLELLETMGAHFAAAVYSHRLLSDLGFLLEVGRSLVATLELPQVLDAGARNLARIVGAPDAYLVLVDESGGRLVNRAATGTRADLLGATLPLGPPESSLAALVVDRREPVVVEDVESDPRSRPELRRMYRARALLGLPLVVRGRTIGAAMIVDPAAPRRFTPAEVERAAAIANQLAVAADNARLYDDLRRSYAELARAQEQLVHRERLAALGELAALVAHEVRNPLGVIFNSLGALRRIVKTGGDARMLFDIVGEEADRLNRIVGDLLDFARPRRPTIRPEPLERILEEAVAAAAAQAPPALEVVRDVEPGLPPVPADARQLRQALVNVAQNAVQAMPQGGRLTVRARRDGAFVRIEIADSGPGVPDELRQRIFEPFFTTRASGTGLGLAVVRRVAEDHRGTAEVEAAAGGGAAFVLRLPLDLPRVENPPGLG